MTDDFRRCRLAALILLSVVGCGGTSVTRDQTPAARDVYPESRFIVGRGFSTKGRREAESDARARVAEQIRSSIRSAIIIDAGQKGGRDYQNVVSRIVQTADIAHAELIRIAPGSNSCDRSGCNATAILRRSEAVRTLIPEYEREAVTFRQSTAVALSLTDPVRFTTSYRRAEESFRKLAASAFQIRVIGHGRYPEFDGENGDDSRFRNLLAIRERLLSMLRATILPGEVSPPSFSERLANAIMGALSDLGVSSTCGQSCAGGYSFAPVASIRCEPGHFGPVCRLDLKGTLRDCSNNIEVAPISVGGNAITGAHPRERDAARAEVFRKTTPANLKPLLEIQLHDVLPIR